MPTGYSLYANGVTVSKDSQQVIQKLKNKQDIKAYSLELAYLSYNIYKLKSKAKTKVGQDV